MTFSIGLNGKSVCIVESVKNAWRRYWNALPVWVKFWQRCNNLNIVSPDKRYTYVSILSRGRRLFAAKSEIKFMELLPWWRPTISPVESKPTIRRLGEGEMIKVAISLRPPELKFDGSGENTTSLKAELAAYSHSATNWSWSIVKLIQEVEKSYNVNWNNEGRLYIMGPRDELISLIGGYNVDYSVIDYSEEVSIADRCATPTPSLNAPSLNATNSFSSLSSAFPYLRDWELVVLDSQVHLC